jgi:hypothetical protein
MFGVALAPGLLVGTATAGTLELSGTVRFLAIVVGLLAAVATIAGVIYGVKWKSAYDVEHALKGAVEDRLELVIHERDEAREKLEHTTAVLAEANATIARLEGLPDFKAVMDMIGDSKREILEALRTAA